MRPLTPSSGAASGPNPSKTNAVKSILKQPTSVLGRRKTQHPDLAEPNDRPESPRKKRKVLFDEVKNVTYELAGRSMDDVKREVRTALEEHLRGNDGPYDTLKELFANDKQGYLPPVVGEEDDTLRPHELQVYVLALTSYIPILKDRACNGLVKIILQCSWLGRDDGFLKVFTHFLAALVSAQGSYLLPVLSMMVERFRDSRPSAWTVPDFPEIGRERMRERLHSSILYVLQMFPSAKTVLEVLLNAKYPFPDESLRVHMAYIDNLMRVESYVPDLREDILDLILNRVVKIDSQMQVDLEDLDDEFTAAVMYALGDTSRQNGAWEEDNGDDGDESDTESLDSDDPDFDREAARIRAVKESVEKMDAVLDTLFEFYTPYFADPGSDKAFDTFTILLRQFDHVVLPTYRSRHTQFLMLHFAQQHERLTDAFCGQLISTAFQVNTPKVLKQAAVAYLASFIARGAHIPAALVRTVFELLIHHMNQYRDKYEPMCTGPDLKRFHAYYSLVQATMYIFCFRWQDLIVSAPDFVDADDPASYIGQDMEWIGYTKQSFSTHIFGRLNPLKVCAPGIVEEFARLAHRLNFMYIYPLMEGNKRIRLTQYLSSTYATGGALRDAGYDSLDESFHQLDPYFPFDPYQLPVSKRWLSGDYLEWKAVPGLNADEDEEDEDDDDDDDDSDVDDDGAAEEIEEATATDSDGNGYE